MFCFLLLCCKVLQPTTWNSRGVWPASDLHNHNFKLIFWHESRVIIWLSCFKESSVFDNSAKVNLTIQSEKVMLLCFRLILWSKVRSFSFFFFFFYPFCIILIYFSFVSFYFCCAFLWGPVLHRGGNWLFYVSLQQCKKSQFRKKSILPPWGPEALHSSASGTRVLVCHWPCIPTPESHQWSSVHPEAFQ